MGFSACQDLTYLAPFSNPLSSLQHFPQAILDFNNVLLVVSRKLYGFYLQKFPSFGRSTTEGRLHAMHAFDFQYWF